MNKCDLTGKGKQYGSNVSFSQRHTKKVWKPNLQMKTTGGLNGSTLRTPLGVADNGLIRSSPNGGYYVR